MLDLITQFFSYKHWWFHFGTSHLNWLTGTLISMLTCPHWRDSWTAIIFWMNATPVTAASLKNQLTSDTSQQWRRRIGWKKTKFPCQTKSGQINTSLKTFKNLFPYISDPEALCFYCFLCVKANDVMMSYKSRIGHFTPAEFLQSSCKLFRGCELFFGSAALQRLAKSSYALYRDISPHYQPIWSLDTLLSPKQPEKQP